MSVAQRLQHRVHQIANAKRSLLVTQQVTRLRPHDDCWWPAALLGSPSVSQMPLVGQCSGSFCRPLSSAARSSKFWSASCKSPRRCASRCKFLRISLRMHLLSGIVGSLALSAVFDLLAFCVRACCRDLPFPKTFRGYMSTFNFVSDHSCDAVCWRSAWLLSPCWRCFPWS
jgi:hypothetical protein